MTLFHIYVVHEDVSSILFEVLNSFCRLWLRSCSSLWEATCFVFVCVRVNVLVGKGETELIPLADDRYPGRVRVQAVITVATMCGSSR